MSDKANGMRLSCSTFDAAKILYEHLAEQVTDDYSFTAGDTACRVITLQKYYLRLKNPMVVCVTLHDVSEGSFLHLSITDMGYTEDVAELAYSGSLKKSIWQDLGALYDFLNPVMTELRKYRIGDEPTNA